MKAESQSARGFELIDGLRKYNDRTSKCLASARIVSAALFWSCCFMLRVEIEIIKFRPDPVAQVACNTGNDNNFS